MSPRRRTRSSSGGEQSVWGPQLQGPTAFGAPIYEQTVTKPSPKLARLTAPLVIRSRRWRERRSFPSSDGAPAAPSQRRLEPSVAHRWATMDLGRRPAPDRVGVVDRIRRRPPGVLRAEPALVGIRDCVLRRLTPG